MKRGSIRLRLWSAAAISIVVALALAGLGLSYLFELHVERRIESELTAQLNQLIGATRFAGGTLQIKPELSDPRFGIPLSGFYWQVEDVATGTLLRSRSLWDSTLLLPDAGNADGALHLHELNGPGGALLVAVERTIVDAGGQSFRALVAEDHRTVTVSIGEYVGELIPAILLLAAILIAANFVQITVGLAPLEALRSAVRDVIGGREARLKGAAPREVQPLADEINRLLDVQEKALERARSRATDLAHGLKTPLQVLSADIRTLRGKGEGALAEDIEKSVAAIRRHIERELARARLAPGIGGRAQSGVAEVAARIVDVVKRTPAGEDLIFEVTIAPDLVASIDEGDLAEILGNLVENAARFARSRVRIEAAKTVGGTTINVADDGPGIPDHQRDAALARGVRLDADGEGTGLGLAIVSDVVDAYGGTLTLADAAPGLKISVHLPGQP